MTAPAVVTPLLALDLSSRRAAFNKLDLMGTLIGTFAPDIDTTDGDALTFGYRGGRFIDDLGGVGFEPDGTIAIPNNVTRFVHFDPVNGVTVATSIDRLKFVIAEVRTGSAAPGDSTFHVEDLRDMNLVGPNRTRHRGAWAAGNFLRNDLVTHLDALWIANTTTTTEEPGTDSEWDLILYGLPDPALADEDDVLTIVGGVPVWAAGGGGTAVDAEAQGSLVESSITRLNLHGAGVSGAGDGIGGVDYHIPGNPFVFDPEDFLIPLSRGFWQVTTAGSNVLPNSPFGALTGVASAGFSAPTTGSFQASKFRVNRSNAAIVNTSYGWHASGNGSWMFWRGDAADVGGFQLVLRFSFNTIQASHRFFAGLRSSAVQDVCLGADPSSRVNLIGFGRDAGDTNLQLIHNDAAGAATKTDTGFNIAAGVVYYLVMTCAGAGADIRLEIFQVDAVSLTSLYSATPASDIPGDAILLAPQVTGNSGATTTGAVICFHHWWGDPR